MASPPQKADDRNHQRNGAKSHEPGCSTTTSERGRDRETTDGHYETEVVEGYGEARGNTFRLHNNCIVITP
jgi:hypothetical protein